MIKDNSFHSRSLHRGAYDFDALVEASPKLRPFVTLSPKGEKTLNFADPKAVVALNQALLCHHYQVQNWSIPKGHLCPPVPSRADYLHHLADLLSETHDGKIPVGPKIKGLDIGAGTSCIYPLLGHSLYGWKFVATDISSQAINNIKLILASNPKHQKHIKTRFQKSPQSILKNLIKPDEKFDFTMCNPPFYSSAEEALLSSKTKVKNLNANKLKKGQTKTTIKENHPSNFGGKNAELWCPGGELEFIKNMIQESVDFKDQVGWFSSLVSQKSNLAPLRVYLKNLGFTQVREIQMKHGKKISHILAWRSR